MIVLGSLELSLRWIPSITKRSIFYFVYGSPGWNLAFYTSVMSVLYHFLKYKLIPPLCPYYPAGIFHKSNCVAVAVYHSWCSYYALGRQHTKTRLHSHFNHRKREPKSSYIPFCDQHLSYVPSWLTYKRSKSFSPFYQAGGQGMCHVPLCIHVVWIF